MKISAPGIYAMSAEDYHADAAPQPSLSSSGAFTLATECPAAFEHERRTKVFKRAFDIGTASHLMTLEPDLFDERVLIIDGRTKDGKPSKGYQSEDARAQRDAAYAAGKTPLLPEEADLIRAMRDALLADPIGRHAFTDGAAEQSIFWRDAEFGIWCRSRPDWIPAKGRYLINWKTAASAHPDDVAAALWKQGYFAKSAWEMDAVEAATGNRPERFCLLVQSKQPPHLVVPVWLHPDDLEWGRILNRYARGLYAWCQSAGQWPGYAVKPGEAPRAFDTLRIPGWAIRQLEDKHAAGAFEPPAQMEKAA